MARRRIRDPDPAAGPGLAVLDAPAAEPAVPLPPAMDPPSTDREAALADYLTRKFLATYHHPFWERVRQKGTIDHAFNTGTEQWDADVRSTLQKAGRAVLQINQVRPVIEVVKGYEAAAPLEGKPAPTGPEDTENVLVFERLAKHASKRAQTEHVCSDGFGTGIVGGLAAWYVGVDYAEDFIYGHPKVQALPWADFCYDVGAQEYDLSDARELFWFKRVAEDDLIAQYPDKEAEITAALTLLPRTPAASLDGLLFSTLTLPAKDRHDGYASPLLGGLQLYDATAHDVLVVECWYRTWAWDTVMVDKRMQRSTVVAPEIRDLATELARLDPQVRLVKKAKREFTMGVFLPATKTWLAGGHPFDNDRAHHPFVQFLAYREGQEILGLVRNLLDMQRDVNKRRSAEADFAGRAGRYKNKAHRGSVERPEDLDDDTATTLWMTRPDLGGVAEVPPPPWPAWMTQGAERSKEEIREASLVNAPLQGQGAASQSGRALAHLQQQGQIGMASLFRNYKRSRYLLTRAFLKRVQQCYSAERTLRLDVGAGQTAWVTINQHTVDANGTIQVIRNIPSLEFDVEIVDAPITPTARMAHLILWLEVLSKFPPEYAESVADITLELMDTPHRDEAIQRFRAIMAKKGLVVESPGLAPALAPAGGNGAAAPGPGVTPGLAHRVLAGPAGIPERPMTTPLANNLQAVGLGTGGML